MPSETLWPWLGECSGTSKGYQVAVVGPEPSVNVEVGLGLLGLCLCSPPALPHAGPGDLPFGSPGRGRHVWECGAHWWGPQSSGRCSSCPQRVSRSEGGEVGPPRPAERALGSFPWGSRVFASQPDQSLVDPRGDWSTEQRVLASPSLARVGLMGPYPPQRPAGDPTCVSFAGQD